MRKKRRSYIWEGYLRCIHYVVFTTEQMTPLLRKDGKYCWFHHAAPSCAALSCFSSSSQNALTLLWQGDQTVSWLHTRCPEVEQANKFKQHNNTHCEEVTLRSWLDLFISKKLIECIVTKCLALPGFEQWLGEILCGIVCWNPPTSHLSASHTVSAIPLHLANVQGVL